LPLLPQGNADIAAVKAIVEAAPDGNALKVLEVAADSSSGLLHLWLNNTLDKADTKQQAMRQLRSNKAKLSVQHSAQQLGMCQRAAVGSVSCGLHSVHVASCFAITVSCCKLKAASSYRFYHG
jgi:hypothetical protein